LALEIPNIVVPKNAYKRQFLTAFFVIKPKTPNHLKQP